MFYNLEKKIKKECQIVLYRILSDNEGYFITSDNPAFEFKSNITLENRNGFYFPLTPKYLLMICRNDEGCFGKIAYRTVKNKEIKEINNIILNSATENIVSTEKHC